MAVKSHLRCRRSRSAQLAFEQLDARICLAVDVSFDNGVLTLAGTPENDTIHLHDSGDGTLVVEDGATGETHEFRDVKSIVARTGDGDDVIKYHRRGGEAELPSFDLTTGEGNDAVLIGLLLPAVQKVREAAARAEMKLDLGEGDDRARVSIAGVPETALDITSGEGDDQVLIGLLLPAVQKVREAAARAKVDTGDGNDTLRVSLHGVGDAQLDLTTGEGDDTVGLLLPAVQKVREAASRMKVGVDLGAGNDKLRMHGGANETELGVTAGEGDDSVLIGLLLPAVQKVRAAAAEEGSVGAMAKANIDLGEGNNHLRLSARGIDQVMLDVLSGRGDDDVTIGLLLPAVQKVREAAAKMHVDLGAGNDQLRVDTNGLPQVELDVSAGEGDDAVLIGLLLPAVQKVREAASKATVHVDLGDGADSLRLRHHGFDAVDTHVVSDDQDDVQLSEKKDHGRGLGPRK